MLNRRATIVSLTVELIKKYILWISEFSTEQKVKVELDLSNYAKKK